MSTAVAPGVARAHGFRAAEKGKQRVDSEEPERNRRGGGGGGGINGFRRVVDDDDKVEEDDEEGEEAAGSGELRELEEALSENSSIGAASSDSSSIGEDSSSEKDEDDEVETGVKPPVEEVSGMGLGTIESLEDALPNKRGLSNFYAGKSKSFTSLAEAVAKAAAKEIAKPENPFNKRRRVLAAWSRRRASCSSLVTTYLPPLLSMDHTVMEGDEGEEDEDRSNDGDEDDDGSGRGRREKAAASSPRRFPPPRLHSASQKGSSMMTSSLNPNTSSFRSPRSYSLSDLQNAGYN